MAPPIRMNLLRKVYYNKRTGQGTVCLSKKDWPKDWKPEFVIIKPVKAKTRW
jgi:hypothetical protein